MTKAKALNTESLCIKIGEAVWRVRVDLHVMNADGNLVDLCMIAAMITLNSFLLPNGLRLSIHFLPVCVTIGIVNDELFLVAPSGKEEALLKGKVVITLNVYGDILGYKKTGGISVK